MVAILSIPVGSQTGALACTSINIVDDMKFEGQEYFSVHITVEDLNVVTTTAGWASIFIADNDGIAY